MDTTFQEIELKINVNKIKTMTTRETPTHNQIKLNYNIAANT